MQRENVFAAASATFIALPGSLKEGKCSGF